MHQSRRPYIVLSVAFFLLGCAICLCFPNHAVVRGFFGDVIAVMFIYTVLQSIWPWQPMPLAISVFTFACCIELVQYFSPLTALGIADIQLVHIFMGNTFDVADLGAYLLGVGCVYTLTIFLNRKYKSSS